ncbi:MAG: hypothetical protein NZ739_02605, partial [Verrucomicrobiae bacterium]|nr:hypothetical protein [Verrucomicrobiae bacterium]
SRDKGAEEDQGHMGAYVYVKNNPLNSIDPDGLKGKLLPTIEWLCCITAAACAGVAGVACAVICAGGHWDDPDDTFHDCWSKCIEAATTECPAFDYPCYAAAVCCGFLTAKSPFEKPRKSQQE